MMRLKRLVSYLNKLLNKFFPRSVNYSDLEKLIKYFDVAEETTQILYLGDSVVERISDQDHDKRTLDAMLVDVLNGKKSLVCISHSGYHMKVYLGLVSALRRMRHKPQTVILPINMRSFSPQWDLEPSWQFDREIRCLLEYAANGSRVNVIEEEDLKSVYEEFDATPVRYPLSPFDQVGQFRLVINGKPDTDVQIAFRSKQLFIFHYMHALQAWHPKLKALIETLEILNSMNLRTLVYVTPLNYFAGRRFVGDQFVHSVQENVAILAETISPFLKTSSVQFQDHSLLLNDQYFFNPNNSTEHLNQEGRLALVPILADGILCLSEDICTERN